MALERVNSESGETDSDTGGTSQNASSGLSLLPAQLSMFGHAVGLAGTASRKLVIETITRSSSLSQARSSYQQHLKANGLSDATVHSYSYDLARFADRVGNCRVCEITDRHVADFLGLATNQSSRKRRLTTLRSFFLFLIETSGALHLDPTECFRPPSVPLKQLQVLTSDEQRLMIAAADRDEAWSGLAVRLMLRMGLARSELLALTVQHIEFGENGELLVSIEENVPRRRPRSRSLSAAGDLSCTYQLFLERALPQIRLFPMGYQAINGMVQRVGKAAGRDAPVTPQMLRHTFGVEFAKTGADVHDLIRVLGLVDEARNRKSVERYLAEARSPIRVDGLASGERKLEQPS
ncbi:hypothetical protein BH23CHL5_BH23CHL5_05630 [soil metagenome]